MPVVCSYGVSVRSQLGVTSIRFDFDEKSFFTNEKHSLHMKLFGGHKRKSEKLIIYHDGKILIACNGNLHGKLYLLHGKFCKM